ncbi:apolipoprotein D-like [Neodiprion pinetum]|uniref:Apolipoprotein D n=1 Tax=Neodiprion lecontei TaxID=441921 RepID=A0A6J0C9A6_NEOLC|nr:apolipoprotein D [Neodiprion lecontei]XP_015523951.1 apolipoprotein D [Neodiprion lecontei]XP_046423468.1 apolipoprotein D-like [Neodiprion fabricii]XP_046423469.1 apolipoprotein D-like [Neodiprion fabricii]XP_046423470.1 apolipoprotein D-like [Neodiprion fabricii]XP_046479871.1 apolipoprotein D-like [Neodiprion pinetum]XP_046479872.1 apolipoprotein D-like [Neodiprion pinetum]XP_046479873.1 apolipoprotein D-like [Neodiprion pinetum]XP_046479874.1 apolipoprotein D-like [Neodiprion pinetum
MLWITLVLFFVGGSLAQVPFLGVCPAVETVPEFDAARYMGKWYEAEKYFALFQFGGKCVTANYALSENGSVKIRNSQISSITGVASSLDGIGRLIGRSDDAKLTITFPSLPVGIDAPYWILDTDYDNWAVVWSCTNFGVFSVRYSWILTRERNPSVAVLEEAYRAIDRNKISRAYFLRTDQKNCPAMY